MTPLGVGGLSIEIKVGASSKIFGIDILLAKMAWGFIFLQLYHPIFWGFKKNPNPSGFGFCLPAFRCQPVDLASPQYPMGCGFGRRPPPGWGGKATEKIKMLPLANLLRVWRIGENVRNMERSGAAAQKKYFLAAPTKSEDPSSNKNQNQQRKFGLSCFYTKNDRH